MRDNKFARLRQPEPERPNSNTPEVEDEGLADNAALSDDTAFPDNTASIDPISMGAMDQLDGVDTSDPGPMPEHVAQGIRGALAREQEKRTVTGATRSISEAHPGFDADPSSISSGANNGSEIMDQTLSSLGGRALDLSKFTEPESSKPSKGVSWAIPSIDNTSPSRQQDTEGLEF